MSATSPDKILRYKGFNVEIRGVDGGETSVDSAWESVTGGDLTVETVDCDDADHQHPPGKAYVAEIILRGAMTDTRSALCAWLNDVLSIAPNDPKAAKARRTLIVTPALRGDPNKDVRSYVYRDCFPVGYVFPRMSVTNTTGNVMEEVRIKPVRCELK